MGREANDGTESVWSRGLMTARQRSVLTGEKRPQSTLVCRLFVLDIVDRESGGHCGGEPCVVDHIPVATIYALRLVNALGYEIFPLRPSHAQCLSLRRAEGVRYEHNCASFGSTVDQLRVQMIRLAEYHE